uniref:Uncharacterized protein n=1 Tax=Knipowitschia caucasica TaxID=637954 RepID=A0AAV2JKU8_KNICA
MMRAAEPVMTQSQERQSAVVDRPGLDPNAPKDSCPIHPSRPLQCFLPLSSHRKTQSLIKGQRRGKKRREETKEETEE